MAQSGWVYAAPLLVAGCLTAVRPSAQSTNAPATSTAVAAATGAPPGVREPTPSETASIRVTPTGVLLDGELAGVAPPLKVERVDKLFELLVQRSAQLEQMRYHRRAVQLSADELSDAAQFKSAFQAVEFAGWPPAVLETGQGPIVLHAFVPRPAAESAPTDSAAWRVHALKFVLVVRAASFELWRSKRSAAPSETAPAQQVTTRLALLDAKSLSSMSPALFAAHGKVADDFASAVLLLEDSAPFGLVQQALQAWVKHATALGISRPVLHLRTSEPSKVGAPPQLPTTGAKLPPELIQAIVRDNYNKFRACYEDGLGRDATLSGKVSVRFVIGVDGTVRNSVFAPDSTMKDAAVSECVVRGFRALEFPEGETVVTVVYPIVFSPTR